MTGPELAIVVKQVLICTRLKLDNGLSIINARDYGVLGDGTTDDTTAMQAALTATENKILVVPPGVYKLSSQLISHLLHVLNGEP